MSASPRGGGLHPFRLVDIPISVRQRAADRLLRTEGTRDGMLVPTPRLKERLEIGVAANNPSGRVYYVSKAAWNRVMKARR